MAKVPSMSEVVLKYEAAKGIQKDQSGNGYDMSRVKNAKVDKTDGIVFAGNTRAELPVPEIGYNYTVRFDLCPSAGNEADAVLFKSPNAVVSLNAEGSGKAILIRLIMYLKPASGSMSPFRGITREQPCMWTASWSSICKARSGW